MVAMEMAVKYLVAQIAGVRHDETAGLYGSMDGLAGFVGEGMLLGPLPELTKGFVSTLGVGAAVGRLPLLRMLRVVGFDAGVTTCLAGRIPPISALLIAREGRQRFEDATLGTAFLAPAKPYVR